jgi:thiamine biosynthesis protein ThiI
MHRIAEKIAKRDSYDTLITGDNLSQVASQTLKNINAIDQATSIFIMRPLISFDKLEIINVAKRIDTFSLSILPYEDCCTIFTPRGPLTKSTHEKLLEIEGHLELTALEVEAISRIEII